MPLFRLTLGEHLLSLLLRKAAVGRKRQNKNKFKPEFPQKHLLCWASSKTQPRAIWEEIARSPNMVFVLIYLISRTTQLMKRRSSCARDYEGDAPEGLHRDRDA